MHCSIVMPAYNTEQYIGEAIQSIVDQDYKHWDLMVVDDGSDDHTFDVATRFCTDSRISVIRSKKNLGAAGATKLGIDLVSGPLVTVVDSDDRIFSKSLSVVTPYFRAEPKLGFAWSNFIMSNGRVGWTRPLPSGVCLLDAMLKHNWWFASHQRFFRKSFYLRSPQFNSKFRDASDYQLAILMASTKCATEYIPQITYWYRINRPGSISKRREEQRRSHYGVKKWARKGFT